jgi:spore coat polysaccharide biosynthesis protein SpsF
MKVVTIIQARTSSSRLRNKVLFNLNGKTLLGQVIESAKSIKKSDEIWVATSINHEDDVIEFICKENNINCFRGSLNDVRSRFYSISKKTNADIIVRVTADNPFTEPSYADQMINYVKSHIDVDYVCMKKTMILEGTGSEVFTSISLNKSIEMSNHENDLEHVTPLIINNNLFKSIYLKPNNIKLISNKPYSLSVDTINDYLRIIAVISKYSEIKTLEKILIEINNNKNPI